MLLSGEYKHSIDGKGRVFIPIRFREDLSETLYACKLLGNCICVFSDFEWKKLTEKLDATGAITDVRIRRRIYAGVKELTSDSQGRVALPLELRQRAGIGKDVTIIGMKDHFEIWDNDLLEEDLGSVSDDELIASLKGFGL